MKLGKAYAIDWLDHFDMVSDRAWVKINEISTVDSEPCLLRTIGYVVKITKESVFVAHTHDVQNAQSSAPAMILRAAIVKETEIKLPPLRRENQKGV